MEGMMPVIKEAIVSSVVATATRRGPRKKLAGMALMTFAGLVFFLAIVFLSLASYQWLEAEYSSPVAFMVIGIALVLLSGVIFLSGRVAMQTYERRTAVASREEISRLFDLLSEDVTSEMAGPIRDNPKTSLAAAAVAGFLAGEKLH